MSEQKIPEKESSGEANSEQAVLSSILAARKAPEEVDNILASKTIHVSISIHKPLPRGKYWRVRSGDEWNYRTNSFLLMPPDFEAERREFMLILPEMEEFVKTRRQLSATVRLYGLAFAVDVNGSPAYWALNLQDNGAWGSSARVIADELESTWGMVLSAGNKYVYDAPMDDLGSPEWPGGTPDDWLLRAFNGRMIDSEDHPVIKALLGKK